jgi:copper homeostasis protein
MEPENLQYEVCVDSASGARVAQEGGAHRVELCGALSVGGITPSAGAIRATRELVEIDVHVLIRPRAGDFHFDAAEIDTMRRDIEMAGEWGAKGVVIGALTNDGRVAVETCRQLIEAAASMSVTFHRAFDVTEDAASALGALIALGCDRVLSSGQAASAWAGRELLAELVRESAGRITILPGAGIDETNAGDLVRETGVRELHFSATSDVAIASIGGRGVAMGSDTSADRVRGVTDVERVRRIISASVR